MSGTTPTSIVATMTNTLNNWRGPGFIGTPQQNLNLIYNTAMVGTTVESSACVPAAATDTTPAVICNSETYNQGASTTAVVVPPPSGTTLAYAVTTDYLSVITEAPPLDATPTVNPCTQCVNFNMDVYPVIPQGASGMLGL